MTRPLWPPILGLAAALTLCLWLAKAHAAIHTDKPVQETAPVASKVEPACLQSTTIMRWFRDDKGKWHILGNPIVGFEPCHI